VGQSVRLRFLTYSIWSTTPDEDVYLDKLSIQELPEGVTLNPLDQIRVSSIRLNWTQSTLPNFREYRVYRSESSSVNEGSTLLTTITNRSSTSFTDTDLWSRKTYYYRVYVVDSNDTTVGSNQASAMTTGTALPCAVDFETAESGWTLTGTWTLQPGAGREGSSALVDSPGDYNYSSDTYAQFAVDLAGADWPVLKFWDRYAFAGGDWGRLWISANAGGSWSPVYGVSETRSNWAEQSIDLSPWKGQSQVWIRFQVGTDGGSPGDGWYLDDVSVGENPPVNIPYPFFETFENGLTNWLHARWEVDTNGAYAGNFAARDTVSGPYPPDTTLWLALAGELSLSDAVNPQLTFWMKGHLYWRTFFRVQASTDGGLNWADLPAGQDHDWNSDWTRRQVSLASYTNQTIRLRFLTYGIWSTAPDEDVFLDNIGIGEDAPGAPTLNAPLSSSLVEYVRPTLVVNNAIDYQSEPVTYQFEVYGDAALTTLVAQNPGIASGSGTTAWQVDVNLQNNTQYWWRCRALQGANIGPWMETATFYVNELNNAPRPVVPVIPPQWVLANTNGVLTWHPTTDPDIGDAIRAYQVQIDDDAGFTSPLIDDANITVGAFSPPADWTISVPLGRFAGSTNLVAGRVYQWRIRAQDTRFKWSAWSETPVSFAFVTPPPPPPTTITRIQSGPAGELILDWSGAVSGVHIEAASTLNGAGWNEIVGPVTGSTWTLTPPPGAAARFYRLRLE
jgi:hypothetical protein